MKIIHITDLHICHEDLIDPIKEAFLSAEQQLKQEFFIEFASSERLESLLSAIEAISPHAVCISGDITSFGDRLSFDKAAAFVNEIRARVASINKIVVTPGNHDVLCTQLNQIVNYKGTKASVLKFIFKKTFNSIKKLLKMEGVDPNTEDPLSNFKIFADKAKCDLNIVKLGEKDGASICCVPFQSVSLDPLWVNIGIADESQFLSFNKSIRDISRRYGTDKCIILALIHHNPISSPDRIEPRIIHAYNSMPGASTYVKEMQNSGADIILYGHQHQHSCCSIDFIPEEQGHVYLIGADSATSQDSPGFNLLEFENRYHARLTNYRFNRAGRAERRSDHNLVFESKKVFDVVTTTARKELRYFRYYERDMNEEAEWNRMYELGAKTLTMVGPQINKLTMPDRQDSLRNLMISNENECVRVLLSDPSLYEIVEQLQNDADKDRLSKMWGSELTWKDQSHTAKRTLQEALNFKKALHEDVKSKLKIRVSNTLMPIGAVLRIQNEDACSGGTILLRLLPVGVMREFDRPILRLKPRHNEAVYRYFVDYIEKLWESGQDVE